MASYKEKLMSEYIIYEYQTQILEHHLDTFGHVNNAKYLELYEEARWDIIHHRGYGITDIQKSKEGPVVLEVTCRFKAELKCRELVTITSQAIDVKSKISQMKQVMTKEDGTIACEAIFTFGYMDLAKRRLIEQPEKWLKALGK